MSAIQQDYTDVFARSQAPLMIKIAKEAKSALDPDQAKDLEFMINLLDGWTGLMDEQSVAATVYSFTFMNIHKSLFHAYEKDDPDERIAFTDGYLYIEFIYTLLRNIAENGAASKYNKICRNAYLEYQGENICAYNVARSFTDAKQFLE